MGNKEADVVGQLNDMLSGLKKFEKDISKFGENMTSNLGDNLQDIIKQNMYEGEKKMKINKKQATVSLAKDGSLKIVFDNPEDAKKFYKGEK